MLILLMCILLAVFITTEIHFYYYSLLSIVLHGYLLYDFFTFIFHLIYTKLLKDDLHIHSLLGKPFTLWEIVDCQSNMFFVDFYNSYFLNAYLLIL